MAFILAIRNEKNETLAELFTTHDCYELPGGLQMFVPADGAWCSVCKAFRLVEDLDIEEHERQFIRFYETEPFLNEALNRARAASKLALSKQLIAWREALRSCHAPARCLECAQHAFVRLPHGAWTVHPATGERIRGVCTEHARMRSSGRLYSVEGVYFGRDARA